MPRQPGADDDVSATALLYVRHLPRYYSLDIRVAHSPARPYPVNLHCSGRSHDNDAVNPPIAAGLQQERDIKNNSVTPSASRLCDKRVLLFAHHRMQNALQPRECLRVAEYGFPQCRAIYRSIPHSPREGSADRPHRSSAAGLHPVHGSIGIEYRYVGPAKRGGGRGLAHSNPAGQAEDDHQDSRSAATKRRSSSSTSGLIPNHA
jgi:hypothetical protein